MTKEIEVLKMALEFAEDHLRHWSGVGRSGREVVAAIKEVLDKPEPWEKFCDSNCVWTDHHPDCKLAEQEPVAWIHNHIKGNVIAHRPATLDRHPDHWTALYPEPKPCPTCEALARTVMLDQTSHDTTPPQRKPLTDEEERKAFEDYAVRTICNPVELQRERLGGYSLQELNYLWRGWKARAAHGIKE